jgi:hypothetical protein
LDVVEAYLKYYGAVIKSQLDSEVTHVITDDDTRIASVKDILKTKNLSNIIVYGKSWVERTVQELT